MEIKIKYRCSCTNVTNIHTNFLAVDRRSATSLWIIKYGL